MKRSWIQKQERSNQLFIVIKKFSELFPDQFEKIDIKRCDHCGGTGFKNITIGYESENNLCEKCRGLGYAGFDRIYGEIVCKNCNGVGCDICMEEGYLDWVAATTRPDIKSLSIRNLKKSRLYDDARFSMLRNK